MIADSTLRGASRLLIGPTPSTSCAMTMSPSRPRYFGVSSNLASVVRAKEIDEEAVDIAASDDALAEASEKGTITLDQLKQRFHL